MYAPTANGATDARPERTTPKMTRTRPKVATTSASQSGPDERVLVDASKVGRANMALASSAPPSAPADLGADVADGVPGRDAAEEPVGEGTTGLKCAPDDRPEGQDQGDEGAHGRGGVLQQLQTDVAGRQLGGRDPRPDHGGDQQAGAQEFGQQPPAERFVAHSFRRWRRRPAGRSSRTQRRPEWTSSRRRVRTTPGPRQRSCQPGVSASARTV